MTDTPKFPEAQDDDVLTATAEEVWKQIAKWIVEALDKRSDDAALEKICHAVAELAEKFPLYAWRRQS